MFATQRSCRVLHSATGHSVDALMRQTTKADSALPCGLHWVRIRVTECSATLCTFFIFLLFFTSLHLFTIAKHYFALVLQYGVARCFFQQFFAKTRFWSFWSQSLWTPLLRNFVFQLCVPFAGSHYISRKCFHNFPKNLSVHIKFTSDFLIIVSLECTIVLSVWV